MGYNSPLLALLFLLTLPVHLSSPDTHSLQYIYTNVRPEMNFLEFSAVGLVNGEQFVYYDSNITKIILKTKWIQKINVSDHEYWERETEHIHNHQDRLHDVMNSVMQNFNKSEGGHVLQLMNGCQLHDDNSTTSYLKFGYNGEDFFHLDLKTGTWTTDNDQAGLIIKNWDPEGDQAKHWKDHLETDCIDWLQKYMHYRKDRKVRPDTLLFQKEVSSPEVVCHATGFFPKSIIITWQKDREDVYENVELRETLPNQDGSFQKRSVLKVSAEELQKHKYTCVIQHSSLEEDLVLPVSERRILRGGGSAGSLDGGPGGGSNAAKTGIIVGVVVALIVLAVIAGFVIWKKKKSDYRPPPREENHGL